MTCNLQVIFHDNELIPTKKPITVDEPVSLGPLRSETQSHSSSLRPPFSSNLTTCSFQKRENEGFSLSLAFYFSVLRWLSFSFKIFSSHFTSNTPSALAVLLDVFTVAVVVLSESDSLLLPSTLAATCPTTRLDILPLALHRLLRIHPGMAGTLATWLQVFFSCDLPIMWGLCT